MLQVKWENCKFVVGPTLKYTKVELHYTLFQMIGCNFNKMIEIYLPVCSFTIPFFRLICITCIGWSWLIQTIFLDAAPSKDLGTFCGWITHNFYSNSLYSFSEEVDVYKSVKSTNTLARFWLFNDRFTAPKSAPITCHA